MNIISETNTKLADKDIEFIERELYARIKKRALIKYLKNSGNHEFESIANYLSHNSITVFPYKFAKEYTVKEINAEIDNSTGLIFIRDNDQRIYMKRSYKNLFRAKRYYKNILLEQDINSPHRYTTENFKPEQNSIIFDIGGAEGFFGLPYLDSAKEIYIFECDPQWIEALKLTYQKYNHKVHIIQKYVSNRTDENHITLDDFILQNNLSKENIFIKIDAEGNEPLIIDGCANWLSQKPNAQIALCVYHSSNHEKYFREKFDQWTIENSSGYMIYYYDYNFSKPYLRRGILRIRS
jgi:hypothetical protein